MVWRNIGIVESVDQQHWSLGADDRQLGRHQFHVQAVVKPDIKKSDISSRPKKCPSEPWACAKRLAESHISDLAKRSKWRSATTAENRGSLGKDCSNCAAPIDSPRPNMQRGCSAFSIQSTQRCMSSDSLSPYVANSPPLVPVRAIRHQHRVNRCEPPISVAVMPMRLSETPCNRMTASPFVSADA